MRGPLATFALVGAAVTGSAGPPALTMDTPMPAWLAPGARFVVGGSTSVHRVSLLSDGARIGSATAGPDGRFSVHARAACSRRSADR